MTAETKSVDHRCLKNRAGLASCPPLKGPEYPCSNTMSRFPSRASNDLKPKPSRNVLEKRMSSLLRWVRKSASSTSCGQPIFAQQHNIRFQLRALPDEIKNRQDRIDRLSADIERRDTHTDDEFSMIVGNRTYSGKGAREQAAEALNNALLSWRGDVTLQPRGGIRGFRVSSAEIHSTSF